MRFVPAIHVASVLFWAVSPASLLEVHSPRSPLLIHIRFGGQTEMETLTKKATNAAVYSGLAQLTIMSLAQRRAYNVFHPHIAPEAIP
ncbi:hypothetical protein C8R44DRAFT_863416 [Mycena epipterygia]|nr:hypothetical protein C8R44DRAFT_863416 [Mycena epipterygia]